jgi:uncharacterized protein YcfJ
MKRTALLALLATGSLSVLAQNQTFVDHARVQDVQPQYENVAVPRQECASQWVNEPQPSAARGDNYTGAIIGGVAGAVVGNQVGKGHGREAATAAGAVIGAITGDRIGNRQPQPVYEANTQREVRTCRTVNDVQPRLTGYRVTYEYRGNQYTTITRDQPGRTLPVQVSVVPMDTGYHRQH